MATYTEHYNLIKPALNDKVNINNLNNNADIIDGALYNKVNTDDTQNIITSANNCMMSDGVMSVEDRLNANTVGTSVDISSYSSTNKYSCPSDGYIYLNAGAQTNSNILANVADANNTTIGAVYATASNIPYNMIYVKKGFKVFATANNGGVAYYKPLA